MNIDPWRWDDKYADLDRDMTVYTLRYRPRDEDVPGKALLCDQAWTDPDECREHFWIKHNAWEDEPADVEVIGLMIGDYLRMHERECPAMNPFWSIGRAEFMRRWYRIGRSPA